MNYKKNKYKSFLCLFLIITLLTGVINMSISKTMAYESVLSDDVFYVNAIDKSISEEHMLILQEGKDGNSQLYVQGKNDCGELGICNYDYREELTEVTHFIPKNIEKVWAIEDASFIVTSDGKLYATGLNTNNRLGLTMKNENVNVFTEVTLPNELVGKISEIHSSSKHTIIVATDGKVYGCGSNDLGQLGLPKSTVQIDKITELTDMSNKFVAVAASENYTVCIDSNSYIYVTGLLPQKTAENPTTCYGLEQIQKVMYDKLKSYMLIRKYRILENPTFKIYASPEGFAVAESLGLTDDFFTENHLTKENFKFDDGVAYPFINYYIDLSHYVDVDNYKETIIKNEEQNEVFCYTMFNVFESPEYNILEKYKTKIFEDGIVVYGNLISNNEGNKFSSISYFTKNNSTENASLKWLSEQNNFKNFVFTDENNEICLITDMQINKNNILVTVKNTTNSDKRGVFLFGKTFEIKNNEEENITTIKNNSGVLELQEQDILNISVPEYKEFVSVKDFNSLVFTKGESTNIQFNEIERNGLEIKSSDENIFTISNKTINSAIIVCQSVGTAELQIVDKLNLDDDGNGKILHTYTVSVKEKLNVSFEKDLYTINNGESKYLYIEGLEGTSYELKSENNSIVSVVDSSSKLIKAEGIGNTKLNVLVDNQVVATTNVTVAEKTITIEAVNIDIKIGEIKAVNPTINPSDEIDAISYSSSNESICFVHPTTGILTPNSVGVTTITISHTLDVKKEIQVTVKYADDSQPIENVYINTSNTSFKLLEEETATLKIKTTPSNAIEDVEFISNNNKVCTVDENGKITAIRSGTTEIVVYHKNAMPLVIPITVYAKTSIECDNTIELQKGTTMILPVTISPNSEKSNIEYASNNTNICTVNSSGIIEAREIGKAVISIKHISGTSKNVNIVVISTEENATEKQEEQKIVMKNSLNETGSLDVSLGGKITLNLAVENFETKPEFEINIISGSKNINIDETKLTIEGTKIGSAKIEIIEKNSPSLTPLYITINVEKLDYINLEKININLKEIIDEKELEVKKEKRIKVEVGDRHQINISGLKEVDLTSYFDNYFVVKTDEKYISYIGNGVLRGNYPGETEVYIYDITETTLLGTLYINIPYEDDFFVEMPEAIGIPQNRTIQIKFNNNILPSSITPESVFIQNEGTGNGTNLERTAYVEDNVLNIKITEKDFEWRSVYLFITPDVKDTSFVGITYPIKIRITFQ